MELDNDILQDFLIETREIIEELQEQLIALESTPNDSDLLNAIFRGFHTIKGGAGFLDLSALVETCHICENAFDNLRNGKIEVTSGLMDSILKGFDNIARMFGELEKREDVMPCDPTILSEIEAASLGESAPPAAPVAEPKAETATVAETKPQSALEAAQNNGSDEITEEEFEALLKELHGDNIGGDKVDSAPAPIAPAPKAEAATKPKASAPAKTKANATESTVRVDTKRLDEIMNMVGELVLVRNRLLSLGGDKDNVESEQLEQMLGNLDLVTGDLQNAVVKTRMQPIKKVFGRFPRLIRDLAKSLGKDIRLDMIGEDTELDKNLVEALADPLIHMVRNSVDHGVEMPEERIASGKDAQGTVTLKASQEGDHILLAIQDDGAGMDPEKLKELAIERGVIDSEQAERMTDGEAFNIIFMPGFSTKTEISDISGRGVGMDVVKTSITQLNGSITIESMKGEGTLVVIKVPLTLAIQPTMMIGSKGQTFALPLSCISEIYKLDVSKTNCIGGQLTTTVRGKTVPLIYLDKWIDNLPQNEISDADSDGTVVLVHVGTSEFAIVVDSVIGQEEVVIKPLGAFLKNNNGVAGATITSDGGIALIVDITSLLNKYGVGK
ncbi:chemotaxis protein CheA [Vibrio crassostreae]|uniref:chemotaxis protein CheA n=1 Tax=Vibrio crassostreae TaxID=246167 RepID=UPI001B30C78B|nr:chemotaxis protein CheA [Vibrio crassostreae]